MATASKHIPESNTIRKVKPGTGVLIKNDGSLFEMAYSTTTNPISAILECELVDSRRIKHLEPHGYNLRLYFHDTFGDNDTYNQTATAIAGVDIEGPAFLIDSERDITSNEFQKIVNIIQTLPKRQQGDE
jgi:hypothetical protein